jgi:hypothetical protein
MRASTWLAAAGLTAAALAAMATTAAAATTTETVPTVISATARWSTLPNTITITAIVQLNDSCWSNPRFVPPLTGPRPPPGTVAPIEVQADYATGKMCAMIVRKVPVPVQNWRIYPNPKLRAVRIVGSQHPVTAIIRR